MDPHGRSALILLCAALALTSCGGERDSARDQLSKSEYQAAILDILTGSTRLIGFTSELSYGQARPRDECLAILDIIRGDGDDVVERVNALEPPSDVKRFQDDFVRAAQNALVRVERIKAQVAAGEIACGLQLANALEAIRAAHRAVWAIDGLENHGYVVFGQ